MDGVCVTEHVQLIHGDCLYHLQSMPDNSVDLVFTSPPYEDARTYGIDFRLSGEEWVKWAFARYVECVRVSRGLVAWVVEGRTRQFEWSATPALLMFHLSQQRGIKLRKPPVYSRVGIPGSGGPDWWRNDYEFIICASKGKLPWSDPTATGKPPKYPPGGNPSHRTRDGRRVSHTKRRSKGHMERQFYAPPKITNPGNIVRCRVGGGHLGSKIAHENEAPFPESLVEPFVRCFCPPGGIVLDPFVGSGTTLAVATRFGRRAIGIDVRESEIERCKRRLEESRERSLAVQEAS